MFGLAPLLLFHSALATALGSTAAVDTAASVPPIEVRAERIEPEPGLRLSPGFARSFDVSRSRGHVSMVNDLLDGTVGVHIRQLGGVGSFSTVSVRGSSSAQVAIFLDGVPLNSAQYGVVNLADLPIEALARIDVYRGGAPVAFDSPGGGVIHLVSRRTRGTWADLSFGRGSFGAQKGDLAAGWRGGARAALLIVQHLASDGEFRYLDDNATPFNAGDDSVRARENNRTESLSATAKAEQTIGPVTLAVTHDRLSKRQGLPGAGANPAERADLRADRSITNVRLAWKEASRPRETAAAAASSLRLYAVNQRDRFADPAGELSGLRQDNDDRTERRGGNLQTVVRLPARHVVTLVGELRRERYTPGIRLPTVRNLPRSERRSSAVAFEDRWSLLGDVVGIVGSIRRRSTSDDFAGGPPYPGALPSPPIDRTTEQVSWTAGVRANVAFGVALKVSASHLERMPTLEELFGSRGGVYGNPLARPEAISTHDAGFVGLWRRGAASSRILPVRAEVEASAYRSDARDLLVFVQNSQRSSIAQNVSAARLTGAEVSIRTAWTSGLSADVSWTRQWTTDESDVAYWRSRELPGRPRDEGSVRFLFARSRVSPWYRFHFVSLNYLDRSNRMRIPARQLHDVGVAVTPWGRGVEWIAECRNVTDRRVEDFAGYPLPGRFFYVGLRVRKESEETHDDVQP